MRGAETVGPEESLRVTLVGCEKQKAPVSMPASKLCTGALFRVALEHAQATSHAVRIVSAEHGLVGLEDVLAPYDRRVNDMPIAASRRWAERVGESVRASRLRPTTLRGLSITSGASDVAANLRGLKPVAATCGPLPTLRHFHP